jgi:hypothetical protein
MTRHNLQYIDAVFRHVSGEAVRIERPLGSDQVQTAAAAQRAKKRGVTEICRDRGDHGHALGFIRQLQAFQHSLHVVRKSAP